MSSLNHWLWNITCYTIVNILVNITRKYTSRIREQLPTPIHMHQHIKTTVLLTSSCNHTHNITFLILLLKKKGHASQKMATLKSVTDFVVWLINRCWNVNLVVLEFKDNHHVLCLILSKKIIIETEHIQTNMVYTIGSMWHLLFILKPIPTRMVS